jgi:hypothetical protein
MKAYKVLTERNGKLYSAVADEVLVQRYNKTKVNKPKFAKSKLFVFKTLQAALNFKNHEHVIYEVEATNATEPKSNIVWAVFAPRRAFVNFWKGKFLNPGSLTSPPNGTLLASSVKLIKKI